MRDREVVIRYGNFWPGLILAGMGAVALWLGLGYGLGDWMMVGAGAFPVLVALVLILCGLLIGVEDLLGRKLRVALPLGAFRAGAGIVGSILLFGLTIERLGLIPASALCALVVSLSASNVRWAHVVGLVLVLPVASWAIFTLALGLQAPAFR